MIRKFRINNPVKGDILKRCKTCEYKLVKEDRNHHQIIFDDENPNNKFLLECILHQRAGDMYKNIWASKEIK